MQEPETDVCEEIEPDSGMATLFEDLHDVREDERDQGVYNASKNDDEDTNTLN